MEALKQTFIHFFSFFQVTEIEVRQISFTFLVLHVLCKYPRVFLSVLRQNISHVYLGENTDTVVTRKIESNRSTVLILNRL